MNNWINVMVSGVTKDRGISSWTRTVEIGTMDWTPDMVLMMDEISEMVESYRQADAERMCVSFEIPLYTEGE